MRARLLAALVFWSLIPGCGPAGPGDGSDPVVVFAAASLRDVAADLGAAFERRSGHPILFNFAGSNTLAQQIRAAPRADVFLSADKDWIRFVEESGLAVAGSRRAFLGNRLVAIRHRDSELTTRSPVELADADFRRLALADPVAVPAGRYARAYLESSGGDLWSVLEDRVVPALDVRAALALVSSDPEIVGVVYRTDAATSDLVRVLFEFPPRQDLPIVYWAVGIRGGANPGGGGELLDFLAEPEAERITRRHGFSTAAG